MTDPVTVGSAHLDYRSNEVVHLDRGTAMWVDLLRFGVRPGASQMELLTELMSAPAYRHDYASPFEPRELAVCPPFVHGRWWLDRLDVAMFVPIDAAEAESTILRWADEQDGLSGQSEQSHERLRAEVFGRFAPGCVLRLDPPVDDDAVHDYGWVTGQDGFHEFVVIDDEAALLDLIVASDD